MPYIYPVAAEYSTIEQLLISRGREGRVGLDIFPVETAETFKVRWSQLDNYYGLQAMRGLDGAPTRVVRVAPTLYEYEPGVFGEYVEISETELTLRAENLNLLTQNIPVGDIIMEADRLLIAREWDRIESSIWTLLVTGVLNILLDGPTGIQTGYRDSYTTQTYSASVAWGTVATAVPIRDFQGVQQLGEAAGYSVDFGAGATAYANNATWNKMLNNTNASDFGGRRSMYGATLNNLPNMVGYLQAQNLPKCIGYDAGYQVTRGSQASFTKFIPNDKVIIVGKRVGGARVGAYKMVRNIVNGGRPGSYRRIRDTYTPQNAGLEIPPKLEVHRGHNGGPTMMFPSAVVVMSV